MTTKLYYNWSDYEADIAKLESQLVADDYDLVIGIARGGLVPAVEISHHLSLPLVSLNWQTRDGKPPAVIPIDVMMEILNKRVLFIDDICDSGETLKQIYDMLDRNKVVKSKASACLHYNSGEALFKPDFYAVEINKIENPVWICYPWERQDK